MDGGDFSSLGLQQEIDTTALVARVMADLGYAAVGVGLTDLAIERAGYEAILGSRPLPYLSANLRFLDTGERLFPAYRIVEVPLDSGGDVPPAVLRIGFVGITDYREGTVRFGPSGRTLVVTEPAGELAGVLPELRAGADIVAVLTAGDDATIDRVLRDRPDVDLVLVGSYYLVWPEPKTFGRTKVIRTGDRGRQVLRVSIRRGSSYEFEFENVWMKDGVVAEDAAVAREVESRVTRFNEESKALMKAYAASRPPPDISPYVGVVKCAECHVAEYERWAETAHARALSTLAKVNRDYTTTCVFCHVTGWDTEAGGFKDPASTPMLIDVQCEACHGPGETHAADPSQPYGYMETPDGCQGCHDGVNSAPFDYAVAWPKIAH